MNKLFLFACVCAALFATATAEKTLFVDTVFPSATTATLLEVLTGDIANVEDASVGSLNLNLPDGLVISTEGPVGLEGSFVSFQSDVSTTVNAEGDIVTDSSDRTSITGTDVQFNVGNDFLLSSRAGRVDIVSHSGFTTDSDETFISSDGAVSINAGSGPIDIFSDDLIRVDAANTDIFGENRVSIFAQHLLALNAGNNLEVVSDNIDLDALGNIDVSSTNSNVQFIGGNQMIFQADFVNVDGERGIDVTSRHGLVQLHGDGSSNVSGDNVNLNARQDSTLWAASDLVINSDVFQADALKNVVIRSTSMSQSSDSFSVDGGEIVVNTDEDIEINLAGGLADSFTASHHLEIRSSDINLSAASTFSASATDNDLFISSHQEETSSVLLTSDDQLQVLAGDFFRARGGQISTIADSLTFSAGDDLTLETSTSAGDRLSFNSPVSISFQAGGNTELRSRASLMEADSLAYDAVDSILFSSGSDPNELTSIDSEDLLISGADALLHAEGQLNLEIGSEFNMQGSGSFVGSFYDDITLSQALEIDFTALASMSLTSTRFSALAETILIDGTDILFSASDEMYFDAAENMFFNTNNLFQWTTDRSVQFDAFDEIIVDRISSITGGRILFEGGVAVEIDGASSISTQTTEIDISTDNNGDVNWSGDTLAVNSGVATEISGVIVNIESASDMEIYGSIDNEDGNVNIATATGTGHSIAFVAFGGPIEMNTNQADPLIDAESIVSNSGSNTLIESEGDISFDADSSLTTIIGGASTFSGSDFSVTSGGDVSFAVPSDDIIQIDVFQDVDIDIERAFTATIADSLTLSSGGDMDISSQGSILIDNSQAPQTSDPSFILSTVSDIIVTAGTFTQTGGDVQTVGGGSTTFTAKERVSFNSYIETNIEADSFLFDATNEGDTIRLEARDFFAAAEQDDVNLLGGDITFVTGENQGIFSSAASSLLLETNRGNPFTWQTLDDFNSTAGAYEIVAHNVSDSNIGVRFMSTSDSGDIVVLSRNGEMRLVAAEDHTYSADHIELYSAGDMSFTNELRPSSGGITLQAAGTRFDPYYGDDVGASFRASGADGFIYILPETGAAHFTANEDIGLISAAGALAVDAKDVMPFTTADGGIELFSHWGTVSLTADRNNLTMTTPLDSEVRASASINLRSTDSMRLTAVTDGVLQAVNNIGMEFSVHSGHIQMLADSNEDITWTTPADYHVQSGDQVSITASDDITFTATNGIFDMHGDTGLGYFVRNGDLQVSASDNIHVTSAENEYINVQSGFENNWTALAGTISITSQDAADQLEAPVDHAADQSGIAMRTERGDVVFQAVDGNIRYLSSGRVQFQADGTNNNIGGSDVDGIFLVAPEIDSLSTHETIFDAEATVRIGANTNPIVTIEAGGDARASGLTITSEGGANISTQQDFLITSAGDFGTASVLESDFVVSGDVTISSTGTSPQGRNVAFETAGEFDIDANTVDITGQDSVFVSSAGFLQLTSTGNNPTSAFIDFSAVTDTFINVNGTFDVDVDDWTITVDTLEMLSNGLTSFSNVNGASSGGISVVADSDLGLTSDVAQSYDSSSGSISMVTTASNGDISFEAASDSSSILFYTGGAGEAFGFSLTARDEVDIDTERTLSITARDQDEDDDEEGNITMTASSDFELFASRDLLVEGAKGLSVATTNPTGTDIDIESDGFTHITAWEDMEFRSTSQEMTIEVEFDIVFSTNHDQEGSIITSSTRDVLLTAEEDSFLDIQGDLSLVAERSIRWQVSDDKLDFESQGIDAEMSFTSTQGQLLIDSASDVSADVGSLVMTATGNAVVNIEGDASFEAHGRHSNVVFESEAGTLTVDALSASFTAGPTLRLNTLTSLESFVGHGHIEATTSGVHPTDGYGMRIDIDDDADISASGRAVYRANEGSVTVTAFDVIQIFGNEPASAGFGELGDGNTSIGQESILDGNAVYIAAKGPGGNINVTSTDDLELAADLNLGVNAANGIEIDSFFSTFFTVDGTVTGAEAEVVVSSKHPYADLIITATDFLNGVIDFNADDDIDIYGSFGVVLELQDDDDQNSVGNYDINVNQFLATGRNDVVFTADGGGDIVIDTQSVLFEAGGDFVAQFRNVAELDSDDFDVISAGPIRFDIGEDLIMDADGDFDVVSNGAFINALRGNIVFEARAMNMEVGNTDAGDFQSANEDMTFYAADELDFDATTVSITMARGGSVDFREGLKIPFINSNGVPRSTTAPCGAIGGNESFFYDPYYKQICHCTNNQLSCQFAYPATPTGP